MDVVTILLGLPLLLLVYYLWHYRRLNMPGPKGHFLSGNMYQIDAERPHQTISKWAKEYGGVFKIRMMSKEIVVVSSVEGITEMLVHKSEEFGGRPKYWRYDYFYLAEDINLHDISPRCSLMKKIAIKCMKQVGEDLQEMEDITTDVVRDLIAKLVSYGRQAVDIRDALNMAVTDITFSLVHGRKMLPQEYLEYKVVLKNVIEKLNPTSQSAILDTVPFTRNSMFATFREFDAVKRSANDFTRRMVQVSLENYKDGEIKCAVDGFIKQMNIDDKFVTLKHIEASAFSILAAGVITTSSATYAFFALMAMHQDIQERAYTDISKVTGQRPPALQDRPSLPFLESMILELLRYLAHVPFANPHKAMTDTTLLGFKIPKGTEVWANLWHTHHDEELWDDPWTFKPARFLDDEGKLVLPDHKLRKQFYVFGAGRRVCAGEILARNRLFLIITSLLQQFKFLPPEEVDIDIDPRNFELGFTLSAKDYKVRVIPRYQE